MLRQMIRFFKLNQVEYLAPVVIAVFSFPIGMGLLALLNAISGDGTYIPMGAFGSLLMGGLMTLLMNAGMAKDIRTALSMGRTRRETVGTMTVLAALELAVLWLAALVLYRVELALYSLWYPGFESHLSLDFLTDLRVMLPVLLAALLVILLITLLSFRFGPRFYTYIFLGFSAVNFANLFFTESRDQSLFAWVAGLLPAAAWAGIGIAAAIATVAAVIQMGRKLAL